MKTRTLFLGLITITMLALPSCETENEDIVNDDSLIIVHSRGNRYAIVSPSSGKVLHEVEPDLPTNQITTGGVALGYNSQKAILLSKEPGGSYVKLMYSCDRKTGANLTSITSVNQWDVQSFSASRVAEKIVFHGHPVDGGALESNIFTINLDGTNVQQLTQNKELVDGIELWWPKIPSFSPNGQKIAFWGVMRTPDPGAYWWGQSIIVMDANGSNKKILYNEPDSNSGTHKDISWTRDGKFIIFLTTEGYSTPNERVKVLRVEDGLIIDITSNLLVDGLHTSNLCTSPVSNTILFNKHQPGGGNLYQIGYELNTAGDFQINGNWKLKCEVKDGGLQFGTPKWQSYSGW